MRPCPPSMKELCGPCGRKNRRGTWSRVLPIHPGNTDLKVTQRTLRAQSPLPPASSASGGGACRLLALWGDAGASPAFHRRCRGWISLFPPTAGSQPLRGGGGEIGGAPRQMSNLCTFFSGTGTCVCHRLVGVTGSQVLRLAARPLHPVPALCKPGCVPGAAALCKKLSAPSRGARLCVDWPRAAGPLGQVSWEHRWPSAP